MRHPDIPHVGVVTHDTRVLVHERVIALEQVDQIGSVRHEVRGFPLTSLFLFSFVFFLLIFFLFFVVFFVSQHHVGIDQQHIVGQPFGMQIGQLLKGHRAVVAEIAKGDMMHFHFDGRMRVGKGFDEGQGLVRRSRVANTRGIDERQNALKQTGQRLAFVLDDHVET